MRQKWSVWCDVLSARLLVEIGRRYLRREWDVQRQRVFALRVKGADEGAARREDGVCVEGEGDARAGSGRGKGEFVFCSVSECEGC